MLYPKPILFLLDASHSRSEPSFATRVEQSLAALGIEADWGVLEIDDERPQGLRQAEHACRDSDRLVVAVGGAASSFLQHRKIAHLPMRANPSPADPSGFALQLAAVLGRELQEGSRVSWRKAEARRTQPRMSDPLMSASEEFLGALGLNARQIRTRIDPGWETRLASSERKPWHEIISLDNDALAAEVVKVKRQGARVTDYGGGFPWRDSPEHAGKVRKPLPHLVLINKDFLVYINAPEQEHGPAHVHVFSRDLGDGVQGARLALVEAAAKPDYTARFPYFAPRKGSAAESNDVVAKKTNKYNMEPRQLKRAQQLCDHHAPLLLEAWRDISRGSPLSELILRDPAPGGERIREYAYQGRISENQRLAGDGAPPRTGGMREGFPRR